MIKESEEPVTMIMSCDNEVLSLYLTIEGTEFKGVEVKIIRPQRSIHEIICRIIEVFHIREKDEFGNEIPYSLAIYNNEYEVSEPEILEFKDEDGNACSLLDYDIKSGDHLALIVLPYL